eukprot:g15207.t1
MDMLVGSDPYADIDAEDLAELDDDIGEAVGEPGADTEEPISADNAEKQELLESLQAAVQYVEAGKALAGLQGLTEDTGTCAEAASSSELPPSSNADPEASESEEEVDNAPATLRDDCCFTLQDILKSAGLSDFSPLPDDHESRKLQRIRKLLPHSQNFCAFVRVGEKILSRALVMGVKRRKNRRNLIQHALAQARLTYSCCSTRQSRQALWRDYADRVVKESAAITGNSDGAQVPLYLRFGGIFGLLSLAAVGPGRWATFGRAVVLLVLLRRWWKCFFRWPSRVLVWKERPLEPSVEGLHKRFVELYLPDAEKGEGGEYAVLGAQKKLQISGQTLAFWDVGPRDAKDAVLVCNGLGARVMTWAPLLTALRKTSASWAQRRSEAEWLS